LSRYSPIAPRRALVAEFAVGRNQADLAADLAPFELELLDLKRTFVEKLFTVHSAYLENHAANKTRHYYDLHKLCGVEEIVGFAGGAEYRSILADVRASSQEHFPDNPLPENDSFALSPAFAPSGEDLTQLESNYRREKHLFFVEPPSLEEILSTIASLLPKL